MVEWYEWATHSGSFKWGCSGLFDLASESGCHAFVLLDDGIVSVHLAAGSVAALDAGEAFVRARVPELQPTDDPEVPVTFWCYGSCGAQASTRTIAVPSWADIGPNYPLRVAAQLERLMSPAFRPASGGQLVLWYGEPGTGKTYALRALAWEWRSWCSFNYITDPETFFGPHTDYMLDVLVDEEPERWQLASGEASPPERHPIGFTR